MAAPARWAPSSRSLQVPIWASPAMKRAKEGSSSSHARRAWLVAILLVDLVAVWSSQAEYNLLERIDAGELVTDTEANRNDNRQAVVGVSQFALYVACIVFFIAWFRQAYRNIEALGAASLRHSHGWAIGSWFVPFLNLVRPKQIANDVWRGSDPDVPLERQAYWRDRLGVACASYHGSVKRSSTCARSTDSGRRLSWIRTPCPSG